MVETQELRDALAMVKDYMGSKDYYPPDMVEQNGVAVGVWEFAGDTLEIVALKDYGKMRLIQGGIVKCECDLLENYPVHGIGLSLWAKKLIDYVFR